MFLTQDRVRARLANGANESDIEVAAPIGSLQTGTRRRYDGERTAVVASKVLRNAQLDSVATSLQRHEV